MHFYVANVITYPVQLVQLSTISTKTIFFILQIGTIYLMYECVIEGIFVEFRVLFIFYIVFAVLYKYTIP